MSSGGDSDWVNHPANCECSRCTGDYRTLEDVRQKISAEDPEVLSSPQQEKIVQVTSAFQRVLLEKDRRYGSSANNPLGIFGAHVSKDRSPAENMILIRLDDKLKRVRNAKELRLNDLFDLGGYISLLMVEMGVTGEDLEALID